jgi:hypothetical protein
MADTNYTVTLTCNTHNAAHVAKLEEEVVRMKESLVGREFGAVTTLVTLTV